MQLSDLAQEQLGPAMRNPALIRSLLLPVGDAHFVDALDVVTSKLDRAQIIEDDRATYLSNLVDEWRQAGNPSRALTELLLSALKAETGLPSAFAMKYFATHKKLQGRNHLLTFEEARGLLSNTLLIDNLLQREGMSTAQVALVLNASQNASRFTWRHVQLIADALGHRPRLVAADLRGVHDADLGAEPQNFADASPDEAIDIVALRGRELGYPGNLADQLDRFLDPQTRHFESAFAIVLHVNALITQFYSHPLSQAAYEFEPRGQAIDGVMRLAHPSYQAAESAYLNNAKGTFAFDSNWAWGRKEANRKQAHALVHILDGLGEMAYHPRRELATWVRQWLLRVERVRSAAFVDVTVPTREGARAAIAAIARANTSTHGVLEQRLIDLVATFKFPVQDGWRIRGVGDSVNASNVSRRKLGDIDAENAASRKVIALEPHGGTLTSVYVDRHKTTLATVLDLRSQEFELIADRREWDIEVTFIAHALNGLSAFTESIKGFDVSYRFFTYTEYLEDFDWSDSVLGLFGTYVSMPIGQAWVPDEIKAVLNSISAE